MAQSYAAAGQSAEQATRHLQEIQEAGQLGQDAMADMLGAIIDGSMSAKEALVRMLEQIAKVNLMKGAMGLLDAFTGGTGFFRGLGNLMGGPSYDGGGYTGNGPRSGGVDGKGGFIATVHPHETIIDHTKGRAPPTDQGGSKMAVAHPEGHPAAQAAAARTSAVEKAIMAEPVRGLADIAIKLCVSTNFRGWDREELSQIWDEARSYVHAAPHQTANRAEAGA